MAFQITRRRGALALGGLAIVAALAACGEDDIDVTDPANLSDELFRTYVAMGNSITAGYQSGGIVDSTQRESYAFYLAQQMGTTYYYQKLNAPGCVAPTANFQTGARYMGATSTACAGLFPQRLRYVNNVAVPGATIADATNNNTTATNGLTLLLSGGRSQVSRMLDASPTFLSVWLGNNDVLGAATTGLISPASVPLGGGVTVASAGVTPLNTFTARYQTMVDSIKLAPRLKGGVLIGVADVSNIPYLFSGALLNSPTVKGGIDAAVGGTVTVVNCPATTKSLIGIQILTLLRGMRAAGQTPTISCTKLTGQTVVGDVFVVDSAERVALTDAVTGYNAFIKTKAADLGFIFWDPNPLLAAQKVPVGTNPAAVPVFPNLADATNPFGMLFSLDGVHPRRAAHKLITNVLVDSINTRYNTDLQHVAGN
jgi:lysophospholipase L1-like esterase